MLDSDKGRADGSISADIFRAVFESSPRPLLLIAADPPRFTMLAANEAHARTFWTTPAALQDRGIFEVFPKTPNEELALFMDSIRQSLERVMASRKPDRMRIGRMTLAAAGGEPVERYWTATNSPILDPHGEVTHIVSASQDVTGEVQERRSEQARTLLMREVDHRARNALMLVQSLVRLSSATSLEEFRTILDGRIASLARAQTSLAARKWEGAVLGDIVHATVGGLLGGADVRIAGPPLVLAASQVQATTMLLHELATNAVKHGSLSQPGGALEIVWSVAGDDPVATLQWIEHGAAVTAPERTGFGARLVQQLVRQLEGEFAANWSSEGLRATLTFCARRVGPTDVWADEG